MSFYSSLGFLVFGSRLRRLSEYFLSEVNKVYEQAGIPFEASWFPVFYILGKEQPMPLIDIAAQLEVSHSAISQLVTSLKKKGLVKTAPCPDDGRRQLVMLSKKGEEMLQQIQPIWVAISQAMTELADENKMSRQVLEAVTAVENSVEAAALSTRILKAMK
ncbi:MarR family winged helix-turn-helix transcriptional regulator [Chitinophaga sancti]|uniref:DNA-binding transcriptional regulator, MarR family n=1 Tax=Chitinophaga sancti TaxID=1004 RepID=A0A1K1PSB3_9BACT|nr:MarR family transcriptional regulator [Chitinophaga sancti]WQD61702.1 MarR family transcriptional regulator [Chitinophaga sancti]WQG92741.1 MarR family transcriptional regulator [Chitinophaga sancti]SFW50519.1 DNA-binding transcriptional regulator, MarR family [Chitinophaga sancti]